MLAKGRTVELVVLLRGDLIIFFVVIGVDLRTRVDNDYGLGKGMGNWPLRYARLGKLDAALVWKTFLWVYTLDCIVATSPQIV
mmetsp:Transcript_31252/g.70719  ORF Transcript_31252/g.70719 Transcript_31252/m.70719 type:complete len:83 (+) Transcript_31252:816-1064(+)